MKSIIRIILVVAIMAALGFALEAFITHRVDDLMKERISAQLGKNHQFTFGKSRFNIFNNDFQIYDLNFTKSLEGTTQ